MTTTARTRSRATLTSAAAAATLALLVASCAGSPAAQRAAQEEGSSDATSGSTAGPEAQAPADRQVTVALDWTPNTNHAGLYLALERGYFADAGLEVTVVEPGEIGGLDLVASGDADYAYSFAEALAPAVAGGVDAVSVAAVIEHNTSSLIFDNASGITRPADLAGKVYGTWGSDLDMAMVRSLIECDGGDPDALQTAPMASDDVRIGLQRHQYDFAWVYDAWDTLRLRDVDGLDVGTIAFIDHTDCIPDWYTPLIATSRTHAQGDPVGTRAFLAALSHGYADAMAEPEAAAQAILAASPELDPQLVELSAEYLSTRYADSAETWGRQQEQVWTDFVDYLSEHQLTGGDVEVSNLWTDEYLPQGGSAQ